ncbi:MAG: hypothetical protein AAF634_02805 [Bacteroidota bacterium]
MKSVLYMILVLTLSFSSCSSQKGIVSEPPLELGDATCQSWKGGRAESGSGMLLTVPVSGADMEQIQLKRAYFRGKVTEVALEDSKDGWLIKANFLNTNFEKPDIIMDADPKKEVGNRPPTPKVKFPFELEQDQCVISYMDGDQEKFFKIEGVQEKKPLLYQ